MPGDVEVIRNGKRVKVSLDSLTPTSATTKQGGSTIKLNPNNLTGTPKTSFVDPEKFEDFREFGGDSTIESQNLNDLSESQMSNMMSGLDVAKRSAIQLSSNLIGGFAQAASAWDLDDSAGFLVGADQEYGNAVYEWGAKIQNMGRDGNKIYQKYDDGGVHPTDGAWAGQFAGLLLLS